MSAPAASASASAAVVARTPGPSPPARAPAAVAASRSRAAAVAWARFAARARAGERGQATVELVGILPLFAVVVLAAGQALAAGVAHDLADHAAEAGAVALLQDGDPEDAARRALPGWARGRLRVRVREGAVHVRLRPPAALPGLGDRLDASAEAHAR